MKCSKCGFVISKDFDRCPYCGTYVADKGKNALDSNINLGKQVPVKIRTFIYVILINILIASILADLLLDFNYGIMVFGYFVSFGIMLILEFIYKKSSTISAYEKFDFFVLGLLILLCGFGKIDGVIDIRKEVTAIAMPIYLIVSNIGLLICIITNRNNQKFHPIITSFSVIIHLAFASVLFAFALVNHYSETPVFNFINEYSLLSDILIYVAFGFNGLFFINFVLVFFAFITSKIKTKYGTKND